MGILDTETGSLRTASRTKQSFEGTWFLPSGRPRMRSRGALRAPAAAPSGAWS